MSCEIKRVAIVLSFASTCVIMAAQEGDPKPADAQQRQEFAAAEVASAAQMADCFKRATGRETNRSWSEIAYAVQSGKADRVAQLLSQGADSNWQTCAGLTLLAMSVKRNDVAVARVLVNAKADLDTNFMEGSSIGATRGDPNGETVLMRAATAGNIELVNLFIEAGANVNRRDMFRDTALNSGVYSNKPEIVRALLAAGAIVRTEDIDTIQRHINEHGEENGGVDNNALDKKREILRMLQSAPIRQKSCMLLARQIKNSPRFVPGLIAAVGLGLQFCRLCYGQ